MSLVLTASVNDPAMTLPSLSRVTAAMSASNRRDTSATLPLTLASTICAFSMRTSRLSRTWPALSRAAIASSKEASTSASQSHSSSWRSPRQKASRTIRYALRAPSTNWGTSKFRSAAISARTPPSPPGATKASDRRDESPGMSVTGRGCSTATLARSSAVRSAGSCSWPVRLPRTE